MSIETRLRETGPKGGGGGGGLSNSGGLAGTGGLFAVYSTQTTLPFSKVLSGGANVTITTDATSILISATTGGAGTGTVNPGSSGFLAYYPANGTLVDDSTISTSTGAGIAPLNFSTLTTQISAPSTGDLWTLDSAGKYIYHYISGTAFYTRLSHTDGSVSSTSAGLMGTGGFFATWSSDTTMSNERVITAGTNISLLTDATNIYFSSFSAGLQGTGGLILTAGTNVSINTDSTAIYINAITGVAAASGGLMGTANFLVAWSSDPLLSNEKILTAGSSVTIVTDSTAIYINAITGAGATSAGLAGTGPFYLLHTSGNGTLPLSKIISAGNNITITTDANAVFIAATTGAAAGTGGLMGTGGFFVAWSNDGTMSNERILTAGTNVTLRTDATTLWVDSNSAGLQGTGGLILTAGTGISILTDSTTITVSSVNKDFKYWYNMRTGHLLGAFASVDRNWNVAGLCNATALAATAILHNSAYCVPFITTRNIKVNSMGINVTIAGSVTTLVQLGIYTNSADECLFPHLSVSTSAILAQSALGLIAYNPNITLSANNLYWFTYVVGRSGMTIRTVAIDGAWPIYGLNSGMGTAPGIGAQLFMTLSNGLPPTMPGSGNVMITAIPAIGVRGSI